MAKLTGLKGDFPVVLLSGIVCKLHEWDELCPIVLLEVPKDSKLLS